MSKRLTALQVNKLPVGRHSDENGLYLNVTAKGSRSWVVRYTIRERSREMGLGSTAIITLADARNKAIDAKRLAADGIDPIEERKRIAAEAKVAETPVGTFKAATEKYIADHEDTWRSAIAISQWKQTMRDYVYPIIGDLAVDEVARHHVLSIIKPLWTTKHETATRVRWRIETVLEAAKAQGMRTGDNPARYKHNLESELPRLKNRVVRHHPAMPYKDLPEFMIELREVETMSARALEFCILTGTRTSETLGCARSEIDFANAIWTIPASRMKAGKEHRIPLSPQAMACLPNHNREIMFKGHSGNMLSNMAMTMTLRRIVGKTVEVTVHGFRSCFRDWAAEQTAFPNDACEIALAHNPKGAVEAAYNRTDYLGMRRALMNHWAEYADGKVAYIDPHADDGAAAYEQLKRPANPSTLAAQ